jgi:hypothetical protein
MGRHQPPTNRSLYLSVAASTLRFAIVVALVVGGVVVINQAFPQAVTETGEALDGGGPAITETPSPTQTPSPTRPANTPSPTVAGTFIAVFNGTSVSGLAADTQTVLVEEFGYVAAQEPDDAPSDVAVTTIYFRSRRDRVEAEFLANSDFFRRIRDTILVAPLEPGTQVDRTVQLAIYIGNDYASAVA